MTKGILSKKNLLLISLIIVFASVIVSGQILKVYAQDPQLEGKVIGFSQGWSGIKWVVQMREDILQTAEKYGLKVIVTDGLDKADKQMGDIEDLITLNVDVILVSTYHAEAIVPAVKKAEEAGIPVVVLSSEIPGVDVTVNLTCDSRVTGQEVGRLICKKLKGKGNVIELDGKQGSVVNQLRGQGFDDILKECLGIKKLAKVTANYDRAEALRVMEDLLQVYKDIDAIYAHNDEMAMGAIQAIEKEGRDNEGIIVIGIDALEQEVFQAIKDGRLYGTFQYVTFGKEAVEAAVEILKGKKVDKKILVSSPFISKENVDEYLKQ